MLAIRSLPDPILRRRAEKINRIDEGILKLIEAMKDTLANNPRKGIGLAAPQVGQSLRLILAKDGREEGATTFVLVNPQIIRYSKEMETAWEGCLSIPDPKNGLLYCQVNRPVRVVVTALNPKGEKVTIKAAELFARVLQHEIDHLEGILITDKAIGHTLTEQEYDRLTDSITNN